MSAFNKLLLFLFLLMLSSYGCGDDSSRNNYSSNPTTSRSEIESSWKFSWKPLLLPLTFSITNNGNFGISAEWKFATTLGEFGIEVETVSGERQVTTVEAYAKERNATLIYVTTIDGKTMVSHTYEQEITATAYRKDGVVAFTATLEKANGQILRIKITDRDITRICIYQTGTNQCADSIIPINPLDSSEKYIALFLETKDTNNLNKAIYYQNNEEVLFLRAEQRFKNNDLQGAIIDYQICIDENPDDIKSLKQIALCYEKLDSIDLALSFWIHIAEVHKAGEKDENPIFVLHRASCLHKLERYREALVDYEKLSDYGNIVFKTNIDKSLYQMNKGECYREIAFSLEESSKEDSKDYNMRLNYFEDASSCYDKANKIKINFSALYWKMVCIGNIEKEDSIQNRTITQAKICLKYILKYNTEEQKTIYKTLGNSFSLQNKHKEAANYYARYLKIDCNCEVLTFYLNSIAKSGKSKLNSDCECNE
jgi:hypothetical protein